MKIGRFKTAWLLPLILLLLGGCATPESSLVTDESPTDSQDLSCAYFYFLWGTHAEYENEFDEAVDAYEKALVCDPSAIYIKHKLPLLHLKKGDTARAIKILQENIVDDPLDTASRKLLAGLLAQQKEFTAAIDQYNEILSYDPENDQVLLRLGVLQEQTGKSQKARRTLKKLVAINPESYFGYLALARMSDSPNEAEPYYLKALSLNWSSELAHEVAQFHIEQKSYDQAIKTLREILDQNKSEEQARLLIVQALLGSGREDEAIVELSLIPRYRSSPVQLSLARGKLYVRLDKYDQAIAHLSAVIKVEDDSSARYLLGVLYSEQNRLSESLEALEGIGADQEEFEDSVFLRSRLLHQQEKADDALAMLNEYITVSSTRRPLFYVMAASLYRDRGQMELASAVLASGYANYPDNERLLFEYGLQLERTDRLNEAIGVMEQLLLLNPDHAEALNFVGYSWADTDRNLDRALLYIEKALELKPENGYIQDSLGWVHFKLGNLERARDELLNAIKLLPDDPYLHDHLGDVYRALGQRKKAIKAYREALKYFEDEDKKAEVEKKIDALRNS
ncbi:MAG: tetratricopeptide repeat protein [Desulfobulbaceae bacterium]|nr:MAG: tetratricopeptide repeat protein [Desulfobulbaceae bacterium]